MGHIWKLKNETGRRTTPLVIGLAALTRTLAIAACGSSTTPTATNASRGYKKQVTFADCMRSHGVPNLPDPSAPGASLTGNTFGGLALPPGLNLQAPAAQAALKACREVLPGGGSPRGGEYPRARSSACSSTRGACARIGSATTPTRRSPATARS